MLPKETIQIPTTHVYVLGMSWRAVRLFDGILLLLEANLPEKSMMLARSLFEESLWLQQLAADTPTRDALVLRWAKKSIQEKRGLIRDAESVGLESPSEPLLATLDEQEGKLQGYARGHGIGRLPKLLSVKDAALRFGRGEDYWTMPYRMKQSTAAIQLGCLPAAGYPAIRWPCLPRPQTPSFSLQSHRLAPRHWSSRRGLTPLSSVG